MKRLFEFAARSPVSHAMHDSRVLYPLVETVHLLGLAVLLGSMLLLNLRFFGIGLRRQTLSELAADFAPWTRLCLILLLVSGVPLFCSKARDLWEQQLQLDRFAWKMGLIAAAVAWHYGVLAPLARRENFGKGRWSAAVALLLWFSAAMAGLTLEFL